MDCRNGMVRFRYRDNRDPDETDGRGRRKTLPLPVDVFLARLLEHVPPPRLQMVRAYGLYASSKQAARAAARDALGQQPEQKRPKLTWRDVCLQVGRQAATVCPVCGAALVVHGRIPPQHQRPQHQALPAAAPPPVAQPPPGKAA